MPGAESRAAQALRAQLQAHDAAEAAKSGAPPGAGATPTAPRVVWIDASGSLAPPQLRRLAAQQGQSVQTVLRLRLRATGRPLAKVLQAPVAAADGAPLQVRTMHFDEPALASLDFSLVLAESADLAVVLLHPLSAAGQARLIARLQLAASRPAWRCRHLLFAGPAPQALAWGRLGAARWPERVRVRAIELAMPEGPGDTDLWPRLLDEWHQMQGLDDHLADAARPWHGITGTAAAPDGLPDALAVPLRRLLSRLSGADGLLDCGVVDLHRGVLLMQQPATGMAGRPGGDSASAENPGQPSLPMLARALCSAHQAHVGVAVAAGEPAPDELLITAGGRHALLRRLPTVHGLGFLALLERHQANLALLRFQLQDADRLMT